MPIQSAREDLVIAALGLTNVQAFDTFATSGALDAKTLQSGGATWNTRSGSFSLANGAATSGASNSIATVDYGGASPIWTTQQVWVQPGGSLAEVGLILSYVDPNNYLYVSITGTGVLRIAQVLAGAAPATIVQTNAPHTSMASDCFYPILASRGVRGAAIGFTARNLATAQSVGTASADAQFNTALDTGVFCDSSGSKVRDFILRG